MTFLWTFSWFTWFTFAAASTLVFESHLISPWAELRTFSRIARLAYALSKTSVFIIFLDVSAVSTSSFRWAFSHLTLSADASHPALVSVFLDLAIFTFSWTLDWAAWFTSALSEATILE